MIREHLRCGNFLQAENLCLSVLSNRPQRTGLIYRLLGKAYLLQGKLLEAEDAFRQASDLQPPVNWQIFKRLADAFEQVDNFDKAETYYQLAISMGMQTVFPPYRGLASLYRQNHQHNKALAVYRDVQKIFPESAFGWLGEISYHLDEVNGKAVKNIFSSANDELKQPPSTGLEYGDFLDNLGYFSKAITVRDAYKKQLHTDDPDVIKILKRWFNQGRLDCVFQLLEDISGNTPSTLVNFQSRLDMVLQHKELRVALIEHRAAGQPLTLNELVLMQCISDSAAVTRNTNAQGVEFACDLHNRRGVGMGGAERQLATLVRAFDKVTMPDSKVSLLVSHDRPSEDSTQHFFTELNENEISVSYYKKSVGRSDVAAPMPAIFQLLPDALQQHILWLYRRLSDKRPKILSIWKTQMIFPLSVAALLAGVPRIILFARGEPRVISPLSCVNSVKRNEELRLIKRLLACPQFSLSCNSHAAAQQYAQHLDYDVQQIHVLHNGIDLRWFDESSYGYSANQERAKLGISKSAVVVGSVFRMEAAKQPFLWLRTAAKIRDQLPDLEIHFLLVGDGTLSPRVRDLGNELGLHDNLHLVGRSTHIKVWLEMMDLFLFTSLTEGLPNVLIEAQSFGVPVVSTNAGGAREIFIEAETGWLVKEWDADLLAERVVWCLNNPDWLKHAALQAREQAQQNFSVSKMLQRMQGIWAEYT